MFLIDADLLGKLETFVYEIMGHQSEQPNAYEAAMELMLQQKDRIEEMEKRIDDLLEIERIKNTLISKNVAKIRPQRNRMQTPPKDH